MKYFKLLQKFYNLRFIRDEPKYHPEESVLHHSLQAYKIATKESDCTELILAALLHDIGKLVERNGHEKISLDILESFGYYNEKVFWLIKNHMRIRGFLSGKMKKYKKVQDLINNKWIKDLIHLRRIDASSRKVGFNTYMSLQDTLTINNLMEVTDEINRDTLRYKK